jgi:integrase
LPVGTARSYLWDDTLKGFGCMVTAAGARSYLVQYQMGGRGTPTRRATIGRHGSPWTADKARDQAGELLVMIRRGVDPVEDARRQREQASEQKRDDARLAFDSYVELFGERYLDNGGRRGKGKGKPLRSADDVKSTLRREWVAVFKARPLTGIRKHEITNRLDEVASRSMSAAIKAHKWLRTMLAWAVDRGDLGASPMADMPPPGTDGSRERWLKHWWELKAVWDGAGATAEPYASFVRALLLTGQRLREVAGMRWSEIDLDAATWTIPADRIVEGVAAKGGAKNKRDHLVPLSDAMVALLRTLTPDKAKRKGPVFTTDGAKPINGFSKPKAKLDEKVAAALAKLETDELPLMQPWVFHDLRRTFSTGLQGLGFSRDLIHAATNHVSGGRQSTLDRIYQLHEYEAEKRAAMQAWGRHVVAVTARSDNNVISLAIARA